MDKTYRILISSVAVVLVAVAGVVAYLATKPKHPDLPPVAVQAKAYKPVGHSTVKQIHRMVADIKRLQGTIETEVIKWRSENETAKELDAVVAKRNALLRKISTDRVLRVECSIGIAMGPAARECAASGDLWGIDTMGNVRLVSLAELVGKH